MAKGKAKVIVDQSLSWWIFRLRGQPDTITMHKHECDSPVVALMRLKRIASEMAEAEVVINED